MKKILSLLLAFSLALSLAACGGSASTSAAASASGSAAGSASAAAGSDLDYIKGKGKMVIGYTVYEPMNYTDADGNFTGFDTELATAVCAKLGVEPEFVEINWDTKVVELDAKSIDCIWNGMTLTEDIMANTATTKAYAKNAQVVVVKEGTAYTSTADLAGKTVVAEAGSAGEAAIQGDENLSKADYVSKSVQTDCLMEVAAGTADAAVLDLTLANAMIGEGTSYPNLKHTDELTTEEYGVGCRKGSDLASYINQVFADSYKDGSMEKIAETYGVQEALVEQKDATFEQSPKDSDVDYIKGRGKLVVGVTDFEPMDYKDKDGNWIGFDADMAKLVGEKLGVEVDFVEIDWDNKVMELNSKNIDVVWNGMTLTSEVTSAMECTNAYCNNAQVVVVPEGK